MANSSHPRAESESASTSSLARLDPSVPPPAKAIRSYRACTNCRAHKTKCDLGDVNNPISPPCSRCKRERKHCEFAESRRGGRANIEAGLAKRKGNSGAGEPSSGNDTKQNVRIRADSGRQSLSPAPHERQTDQDGSHLGTTAFPIRSTYPPMVQLQSVEGIEGHDPRFAAYNNHTLYSPILSTAAARIPRAWVGTLPAGTSKHSPAGDQGFLVNVANVRVPFARNADRHDQSKGLSSATLPSGTFPEDQAVRAAPTGSAFSDFFTSPETMPESGPRHGSNTSRPNVMTPQGSYTDQDPNVSSLKARRMSTSTTESTRRDKDAHNEKLALEDTRSFVINAGMHNESDALQILAMAAETRNTKKRKRDSSIQTASPDADANQLERGRDHGPGNVHLGDFNDGVLEWSGEGGEGTRGRSSAVHHGAEPATSRVTFRDSISAKEDSPALSDITQFYLVEQGIIDPEQVHGLCRTFFDKHHHYFVSDQKGNLIIHSKRRCQPLIPPNRIPRTTEEINAFAVEEPYLVTACIIIASKCQTSHSARRIHEQTWNMMKVSPRSRRKLPPLIFVPQGILAEVNFQGTAPTIGLVEGLLLIAENLPREKAVTSPANGEERPARKFPLVSTTSDEQKQVISGAENRQAWMLIGSAIRMAYGLGLDQVRILRRIIDIPLKRLESVAS